MKMKILIFLLPAFLSAESVVLSKKDFNNLEAAILKSIEYSGTLTKRIIILENDILRLQKINSVQEQESALAGAKVSENQSKIIYLEKKINKLKVKERTNASKIIENTNSISKLNGNGKVVQDLEVDTHDLDIFDIENEFNAISAKE